MKVLKAMALLVLLAYLGVIAAKRFGRQVVYLECMPVLEYIHVGDPRGDLAAALRAEYRKDRFIVVCWYRPVGDRFVSFLPTSDIHSLTWLSPDVVKMSIDAPFWVDKTKMAAALADALIKSRFYPEYSFRTISESDALARVSISRKRMLDELKAKWGYDPK